MRDDKSALLEQAERCRRLAHANANDEVAKLSSMAQEFEEKAARLASSPPLVPSEVHPEIQRSAQTDVVRRAYYLWEQAGPPDGRRKNSTLKQSDNCGMKLQRRPSAN